MSKLLYIVILFISYTSLIASIRSGLRNRTIKSIVFLVIDFIISAWVTYLLLFGHWISNHGKDKEENYSLSEVSYAVSDSPGIKTTSRGNGSTRLGTTDGFYRSK